MSNPTTSAEGTVAPGAKADLGTGTVGDPGSAASSGADAPVGVLSLSESFDLLVSTVTAMELSGAATSAAGVSARMRLRNRSFGPRALGFSSFRRFLRAAEAEGHVFTRTGPNDLSIHTPQTLGVTAVVRPDAQVQKRLERSVWEAFQDRGHPGPHLWNRRTGTLKSYADDGTALSDVSVSPDEVPLHAVDDDTLAGWMREFTDGLPRNEVQSRLLAALAGANQVEVFLQTARAHQTTWRRWRRFLRERILEHAKAWAEDNNVDLETVFRTVSQDATSSGEPSTAAREAGPVGKQQRWHSARVEHSGEGDTYETRVRAQLVDAINRMPLSDLLRLSVPAEYLLGP